MRKGKDDIKYKTEEDIQRLEASTNREPNQGILDHERKRKLEVRIKRNGYYFYPMLPSLTNNRNRSLFFEVLLEIVLTRICIGNNKY